MWGSAGHLPLPFLSSASNPFVCFFCQALPLPSRFSFNFSPFSSSPCPKHICHFPLVLALPICLLSFSGLIFLALFPAVFRITGSPGVNWMISRWCTADREALISICHPELCWMESGKLLVIPPSSKPCPQDLWMFWHRFSSCVLMCLL